MLQHYQTFEKIEWDATARLEDLTIYQEEYITEKYGVFKAMGLHNMHQLKNEVASKDVGHNKEDNEGHKDESASKTKGQLRNLILFIGRKISNLY